MNWQSLLNNVNLHHPFMWQHYLHNMSGISVHPLACSSTDGYVPSLNFTAQELLGFGQVSECAGVVDHDH